MGSEQSNQKLAKSDMLTISLNKDYYYEGQTVQGTVTFEPRMDINLYDIYIRLRSFEYFTSIEENGQRISDVDKHMVIQKSIDIHPILRTQKKESYSLKSGSYKFPFNFQIPKNTPPSFEFPQNKKKASLRYIIVAEVSSNSLSPVTEEYFYIKARPKLTAPQVRNENKCKIKNAGFISRGESVLALLMNNNNFRMGDFINFTAEIDNEKCGVAVKELKVTVQRTVSFKKNQQTFQTKNIIIKKIYPTKVKKNDKGSFHYEDICMKDESLKDFCYSREMNPYMNVVSDLNELMPTMCSNLITCEYSLKLSCYLDMAILSKDKPRIIVPIYVGHQSPREYEDEKSMENTGVNNYGNNYAKNDYNKNYNYNDYKNNNYNNNDYNKNNNYGNNNYNNNNYGNNDYNKNNYNNNYNNYNQQKDAPIYANQEDIKRYNDSMHGFAGPDPSQYGYQNKNNNFNNNNNNNYGYQNNNQNNFNNNNNNNNYGYQNNNQNNTYPAQNNNNYGYNNNNQNPYGNNPYPNNNNDYNKNNNNYNQNNNNYNYNNPNNNNYGGYQNNNNNYPNPNNNNYGGYQNSNQDNNINNQYYQNQGNNYENNFNNPKIGESYTGNKYLPKESFNNSQNEYTNNYYQPPYPNSNPYEKNPNQNNQVLGPFGDPLPNNNEQYNNNKVYSNDKNFATPGNNMGNYENNKKPYGGNTSFPVGNSNLNEKNSPYGQKPFSPYQQNDGNKNNNPVNPFGDGPSGYGNNNNNYGNNNYGNNNYGNNYY